MVGIDDNKVCVKLLKRPEHVSVNFLDVFNEKWDIYLMKEPGKCWSMEVSYYSPQHYTKAKGISDGN